MQAWQTSARLFREGMLAGSTGSATIALWFLVLDTVGGRPLYTPSVLGTAIFQGAHVLGTVIAPPVAGDMVVAFSCVHWLTFAVIGSVASWLLTCAEYNRSLGFGLLFLFLTLAFEFGFLAASLFFSSALLTVLNWQTVLLGNVLAAGAMGLHLWKRHPFLEIKDVADAFFSVTR